MNVHIRSPSNMASDTVLEHAGEPSAVTSVTAILSAGLSLGCHSCIVYAPSNIKLSKYICIFIYIYVNCINIYVHYI